jgi:hypothetical protein
MNDFLRENALSFDDESITVHDLKSNKGKTELLLSIVKADRKKKR